MHDQCEAAKITIQRDKSNYARPDWFIKRYTLSRMDTSYLILAHIKSKFICKDCKERDLDAFIAKSILTRHYELGGR